MQILNSLKAEPLTDVKHHAEGTEGGAWRKKKVRNIKKRKAKVDEQESSECASDLPGDNEGDEADDEIQTSKGVKKRKKKKNKNI